ncbi:MAG TPA: alpha-E domain-containing protein, partial [Aestuariivirga sp.]
DSHYKPWLVSEFLILKEQMPRSLLFTYNWINLALDGLGELYGSRYACHEIAMETHGRLKNGNMEQIFQNGLHEFLQDFMAANNSLSQSIATTYNFP